MRLDIFLPFLRNASKKFSPRAPRWPLRVAKRVLPKAFFADPITGKPGRVRRVLKKIGPTWLSAPIRRVVQGACFALFLWLFFYVCWPYSAKPALVWSNWQPVMVDAESGTLTAATETAPADSIAVGSQLYVADETLEDSANFYQGPFKVTSAGDTELELQPVDKLTAEQLEQLTLAIGPWTLHEAPPGWPSHYADNLEEKETLAAEFFLIIDPLVSISTAIAGKSWVWSLTAAGIILLVCVLIPRGFCGYICPLGTLIDLFDWSIGKRVTHLRVADDGWWVHVKYYLLLATLITAMFGVLISGVVAAIPVITRGMLYLVAPLQTGVMRGWHQVPPLHAGHFISIGLFFAVLGLGLLKPRFWCKYVCPSGAVFSLGNLFRVSERKVEASCINCNKCVEICPFDAIKADFTTRTTDCTLCQTCGGVCPTHAIKFVDRWNTVELKVLNDPPTHETPLGRRGFLAASVGLAAGTLGGLGVAAGTKAFGARLDEPNAFLPIRPPGSVPEQNFLQLCIRCGECFRACPNDVLQSLGFQQGLEGLWTPHVVADWAGCESSCNACTQVCPTGAIRAIPLEEKKVCHIALAIVNQQTCLPYAEREACQLCVDECIAAGYNAIEFTRVGTQADEMGEPIEGTGFLAPVVRPDLCVGCGLCQTRCYGINVAEKSLLKESAIVVHAGEGREDRITSGSYLALREQENAARERQMKAGDDDSYLPDFLK